MFIAVLLPSFQIIKSFKEEDTQVHSFSRVLFSLIECLEHAVFYCERAAKYCVSSLSLKEYYFYKDGFEKCIGCILRGFNCVIIIVNYTAETCIISLRVTSTGN